MTATYFSVENGELRIPREDPASEWRGLIDDMPVLDVYASADGASAVILAEPPSGAPRVRKLVKVSSEGEVLWRGELPGDTPSDCYVSVAAAVDGDVIASSWSGYRVVLSGDSGQLLSWEFTK